MSGEIPGPSSEMARRTMVANRRVDTGPERRLRSTLHGRGFRFRKDRRLKVTGRNVRPDIVFGPRKVAVFVDGCFWHRCPVHSTYPKANAAFWQAKFERTIERDRADTEALEAAGWTVLRFWEHEDPVAATEIVEAALGARR